MLDSRKWRVFLNNLGYDYMRLTVTSFSRAGNLHARKRANRISDGYIGSSKEYEEVVLNFWKPYGIKPKRYWYRLFNAGLGHYDPRFIPGDVWFEKIIPYFNNLSFKSAYTDKAMLSTLFPDVKQPETVVKNMAGCFYDGRDEAISREEAEALCLQEDHVIFKPTIESGGGMDIQFFDSADMPASRVSEIFTNMDHNFIVQRIVQQHPDLARINASTLNTVRVVSFRFKGEVHILSTVLRMGSSKARVDNVSAGGFACPVNLDGTLWEKAVSHRSEWIDRTENGIKFTDIRVPEFERVKEAIKRIHSRMPYFGLVGWDFAVDKDGDPVLIEYNVRPGQNQIGSKLPTFGDLTKDVLDEVFINKSLEGKFVHSNI